MRSKSLRIGVVPYLNMQPLIFGLKECLPSSRVLPQSPRVMAQSLERGELDLAMLPVVAAFEHPEYCILPCGAIVSHGTVQSVLLVGKTAFNGKTTILLDHESRTSNLLCRLLAREWFKAEPTFISPDQPEYEKFRDNPPDNALRVLIGDRALEAAPQSGVVYDFGECWNSLTGLPLVCAVWMVRPDVDLGDLPDVLSRVKKENLKRLGEIVDASPRIPGMSKNDCVNYLRCSIQYDFGPQEDAGLRELYRMSVAAGLSPKGWAPHYYREASIKSKGGNNL
ncbi:MAG: menaquinone biosynthesis protein [bacterium]